MAAGEQCAQHSVLHTMIMERLDHVSKVLAIASDQLQQRSVICAQQTTRVDYIEEVVDEMKGTLENMRAFTNKLIGALILSNVIIVPLVVGAVLYFFKLKV